MSKAKEMPRTETAKERKARLDSDPDESHYSMTDEVSARFEFAGGSDDEITMTGSQNAPVILLHQRKRDESIFSTVTNHAHSFGPFKNALEAMEWEADGPSCKCWVTVVSLVVPGDNAVLLVPKDVIREQVAKHKASIAMGQAANPSDRPN